jgi:hypothetical protein
MSAPVRRGTVSSRSQVSVCAFSPHVDTSGCPLPGILMNECRFFRVRIEYDGFGDFPLIALDCARSPRASLYRRECWGRPDAFS